MNSSETWHLRIRHAVRVATGGSILVALGLRTPATVGCLSSVFYFISVIAGTTENLQGFQLRSASLTFLGALLGASSFALVAVIANTSSVATFFAAIPFILFFSFLRADTALVPLPPVANTVLGFLLISRFGESRASIPAKFAATILDATIAFIIAVFVNLPLPDRASHLGRRIAASQLSRIGALISNVATVTFSAPHQSCHINVSTSIISASSHPFNLFTEDRFHSHAFDSAMLSKQYVFDTKNLPSRPPQYIIGLHRTEKMADAVHQYLRFLQKLRPFGHVSDYACLVRARQLFLASQFEPRILPETVSQWRNPKLWEKVIDSIDALVTKLSMLESTSYRHDELRSRFSPQLILDSFGEAYVPFWVSHFASCAAACNVMSTCMLNASCANRFYPSENEEGQLRSHDSLPTELDSTISPRRWHRRRAEMYHGFLQRFRQKIHESKSLKSSFSEYNVRALFDLESNYSVRHQMNASRGLQGIDSSSDSVSSSLKVGLQEEVSPFQMDSTSKHPKIGSDEREDQGVADLQGICFFGIAAHALSEEIGHVQHGMMKLASSPEAKGPFSLLSFLIRVPPLLWKRVKKIARVDLQRWEIQFAFTHSFLLLFILAFMLFLPIAEKFEASEIAWTFTSAALAAQLSAEPTVFIGAIRVFATILGGSLAYGFNSFLDAVGRENNSDIQFLMIPYMFLVSIVSLLSMPPTIRYAAFLVVVTNAVLLFCPRSTEQCAQVFENQSRACFPTWKYALSRAGNVSIGVILALLFHLLFWPRFANNVAFRHLSVAFSNSARLLGKLRRTYFAYGVDRNNNNGVNRYDAEDNANRESVSFLRESLEKGDLYTMDYAVSKEIFDKISRPVSSAVVTVQKEAGVWRKGPLRLQPLLPRLLPDFVALEISLMELGSLLCRKPIFTGSYGRCVYDYFIRPMLSHYESIQISLNNLVSMTNVAIQGGTREKMAENMLDLVQAVSHLARIRSEIRQDLEVRWKKFCKERTASLSVRVRTAAKRDKEQKDEGEMRSGWDIPRSLSENDAANVDGSLCIDDVVLFNAFSFVVDGCISAYGRIAAIVLSDVKKRLDESVEDAK